MTGPSPRATPYGPATATVRRFLVQLAALDRDAHANVVAHFATLAGDVTFAAADMMLGEVIERSGRTDARDALAGPLMQLVRADDAPDGAGASTASSGAIPLDPIAEPALAALMALLVHDLLPSGTMQVLYAPFAATIPLASVLG